MSRLAVINLIALALAAVLGLLLSVPVLDAVDRGQHLVDLGLASPRQRLHPDGFGPLSGLMLFVMIAPILIAVASSLSRKLGAVALAAAGALVLSHVTSLFEQGRVVAACGLLGLSALAAVAAAGWDQGLRRSRRARVEVMARRAWTAVQEVTGVPLASSSKEPDTAAMQRLDPGMELGPVLGPEPDATHQGDSLGDRSLAEAARLVQPMVLEVIWQARLSGHPEAFLRSMRRGLVRLERLLDGNRALDPDGRGLLLLDRIRLRLGSALGQPGAAHAARRQSAPPPLADPRSA